MELLLAIGVTSLPFDHELILNYYHHVIDVTNCLILYSAKTTSTHIWSSEIIRRGIFWLVIPLSHTGTLALSAP